VCACEFVSLHLVACTARPYPTLTLTLVPCPGRENLPLAL